MDYESQMGQLLSKVIDNEATPEERKLVEDHVKQCKSCADMLAIFRRNEEMLHSALTTEAFGNNIVERVMDQVAPKPKMLPTITQRRWLLGFAAGVAAVVLLGVIGVQAINATRYAGEVTTLKSLQGMLAEKLEEMQREQISAVASYQEDIIRGELRAEMNKRKADSMAYFGAGRVFLIGQFDEPQFSAFDVFRRPVGSKDWSKPINKEPLKRPEFTDDPTHDGAYEYLIRGTRKDGQTQDSEIGVVEVKGKSEGALLSPDRTLEVNCIEAEGDVAKFRITRIVSGKARIETFPCRIGQELGKKRVDVFSGQEIDFATGYVVDRIENADQTITVRIGQHVEHVQRENKRVVLRKRSGTGPDRVEVWKEDKVNLPVQK